VGKVAMAGGGLGMAMWWPKRGWRGAALLLGVR